MLAFVGKWNNGKVEVIKTNTNKQDETKEKQASPHEQKLVLKTVTMYEFLVSNWNSFTLS